MERTVYHLVLDEIDKAWEQVEKNTLKAEGSLECLRHTYAPTKSSGKYGQVRFKGIKYYCHVIAAIKNTNRVATPGEEASHLCGNAWCVNPKHLTFETGELNKSRYACHLLWGVFPQFVCVHEPKCLVERMKK